VPFDQGGAHVGGAHLYLEICPLNPKPNDEPPPKDTLEFLPELSFIFFLRYTELFYITLLYTSSGTPDMSISDGNPLRVI